MAMYDDYQDVAFAGMKVDSGDERVESFPVAANLPIGVVCGTDANGRVVAGPGTKVRGITLHSHTITSETYVQYDCASVMARGLVWARVTPAAAVTKDGPVKFAADGTVSDAGANTLPNAVFRSAKVTTSDGVEIVAVELHNPFSVPAAA